MERALEIATLGTGNVSPNPMVGCIIIRENRIIGEGWHKQYGEAHAEVHAIEAVKDKNLLSDAELFVTLEPCAHFGRTPPCTDLLTQYSFKKIYIAATDPNPLVAGKGIEKLEKSGLTVETGLLEQKAAFINRRFFHTIRNKKPYIILKWAETADGFIARNDGTSKWISNEHSRMLVHKWRSEEDAVLVGKTTAENDNPSLNVRDWSGRNPKRVVIDSGLSLSADLTIFNQKQETLVFNCRKEAREDLNYFIKLDKGESFMLTLLDRLYQEKITSVLVEGGAKVLNWFLSSGNWNEIRRFRCKTTFGSGLRAPEFHAAPDDTETISGDILEVFYNREPRYKTQDARH